MAFLPAIAVEFVSGNESAAKLKMPVGTVKWFNPAKGYGFIALDDGSADVFVHIRSVERAGLQTLVEGQKVSFEISPHRSAKTSAERGLIFPQR